MEKRKKLEEDISVDLYPASHDDGKEGMKRKVWNMLDPHKMIIVSTYDSKWLIIEFEGKQYITDRKLLKGIL
jgi:hypothetical protein